jgi:hypothetical protein
MSKMASPEPFRHLQHKLCAKERPEVKLAVWLPTTKSRESTRFACAQVACDIPLESSQRGLQLFFRPHCDWRSAQEVMCPQSCRSPNCYNFGTPTLESGDKRPFGCNPVEKHRVYTIWGKVVASPKSGPWWVNWVQSYPWLVLTPRVFQNVN